MFSVIFVVPKRLIRFIIHRIHSICSLHSYTYVYIYVPRNNKMTGTNLPNKNYIISICEQYFYLSSSNIQTLILLYRTPISGALSSSEPKLFQPHCSSCHQQHLKVALLSVSSVLPSTCMTDEFWRVGW